VTGARDGLEILLTTYAVTGVSNFLRCHSLARPLAARGHRVTILSSRARPGLRRRELLLDRVRVVESPDVFPMRLRHGGLSPVDLAFRMAFVRRAVPAVVHCFGHRPAAAVPALWLGRARGVPVVADWADLWGGEGIASVRGALARSSLGAADTRGERAVYRAARAVTAASPALRARAIALGRAAESVVELPGGANLDVVRPLPREQAREALGVPRDARVVVHASLGGYDDRLLGEAVALVARADPSLLLLLTAPASAVLAGILKREGLDARVVTAGFVPYERLGAVLACGDVMLLPFSDRPVNLGRYPNKLADYLAAGRPVVTNPTGEIGRFVAAERVGAVAAATPREFAAATLDLLRAPELREEMGRRARAAAEAHLSWTRLADRLEALYLGVVQPAPKARRIAAAEGGTGCVACCGGAEPAPPRRQGYRDGVSDRGSEDFRVAE